jgi:hypothetical protein
LNQIGSMSLLWFTRSKTTFAHVGDLPKKLIIGDKIKPLSFQKVGPENGQLGVTRFKYLVVPSRRRQCQFQFVLLHPKE